MVSRFIIISAAISLLSTFTFAQPLAYDNGASTQSLTEEKIANFRAVAKRNTLDFLTNGLLSSDHEKQAIAPQTNTPIASAQTPAQGATATNPKQADPDEQAGDVFGEGDDQPDPPTSAGGRHEAKRSVPAPLSTKPIAPGSATNSFVTRRAVKSEDEDDGDEDLPDEDQNEDPEEENTSSSHDAKRELKARFKSIRKRDIDRFLMKSQLLTDIMINKTSKFADKIGGGDDDSGPKSDLPNGHNVEHASEAINKAKSLSSSAHQGDVKSMSESH
ncbi:unnamed protein product [Absidia cylindrospora]